MNLWLWYTFLLLISISELSLTVSFLYSLRTNKLLRPTSRFCLVESFGCSGYSGLSSYSKRFIMSEPVTPSNVYSYIEKIPKPVIPHQILSESDVKERLIIVGDVHGCLDELKELIEKCNYDPQTTSVVILGDLVNKGPYSAEVIQYVRQSGFFCIRGNHDDSALCYALKLSVPKPHYLLYLDKLSDEDITFLQELPYSISIPSRSLLFVHAGVVPSILLQEQSYLDLTTIRNVKIEDGEIVASHKTEQGEPWVSKYQGSFGHIYFGHDAKRGLQLAPFATGLDTGCAYGKKLTAMVLPEKSLVQVDAKYVYSPITEKD